MSESATRAPVTSKYEQLYERLWQYLQSDQVADGDALPSEPALAEQYQVSRVTVRKALELLERDRLIVRKRRVGTFASKPVVPIRPASSLGGLASEIEWLAEHSTLRVLGFGRVKPNERIRNALEIESDVRVRRFSRVRLQERGPLAYMETYLSPAIEHLVSKTEVVRVPPILLLMRKGVLLQRAHQVIAAEAASKTIAEHLDLSVGVPVMRTSRVLYDNNDQPIAYTTARMSADRFELHYTLTEDCVDRAPSVWQASDE